MRLLLSPSFGRCLYCEGLCSYIAVNFLTDSGEQVLVDVEDKTNKEITEHIKRILGKSK